MMEQLEQLWYTWSTVGLGSVTGFRVRAASRGVADVNSERYKALNAHLLYKLPYGSDLYQSAMETSPICLAYLEAGNEHIALQKVFAGQDAYGRAGIYFVHLLANLPANFLASDAIQLWKSSSLRTSDQDLPANEVILPTVSRAQLAQGELSVEDVVEVEDYLQFAIQAFLSLGKDRKLYFVAPDKVVATLIWAIMQSLPRSLQKWQKLTFSTYEYDVTKSTAHIVGTSYPLVPQVLPDGTVRPPQDIPSECYTRKGLALNVYTKHSSDLSQGMEQHEEYQRLARYASFATRCLLEGRKDELDTLVERANMIDAHEISDLLFVYKLSTSKLDATDISDLLTSEVLAKAFLTAENIQQEILELAISNPQWLQEHGMPALTQLIPPDGKLGPELTAFAKRIARELGHAIVRSDQRMVNATYSMLFKLASAEHNPTPWVELLHAMSTVPTLAPTRLLNWAARRPLLEQWIVATKQIKIDDAFISPWLEVSWDELEQLPDLNITTNWYTIAITSLIASGKSVPQKAVKVVTNYKEYFESAMVHLMQQRAIQPAVVSFFVSLISHKYEGKLSMLAILLSGAEQMVEDGDQILRVARLTFQEELAMLREHHQLLLRYRDNRRFAPAVETIITHYITAFTLEDALMMENQPLLHSLNTYTALLPKNAGSLLQNWNLAADGAQTKDPALTFEPSHLKKMGEALVNLRLNKEVSYLERLYQVIINTVTNEDQLRCVVESLAPFLGEKAQFLSAIITFWNSKYQKETSYTWLLPYITLTLEYAHKTKGTEKERLLKASQALVKHLDRRNFDAIDQQSRTWPQERQKVWTEYFVDLRPKTIVEKVGGSVKGVGFPFLTSKKPPVEVVKGNTGRQPTVRPVPRTQSDDAKIPATVDNNVYDASESERAKPRTSQYNASSEQFTSLPSKEIAVVNNQPISYEVFKVTYKVYSLYMLYRFETYERAVAQNLSERDKWIKKKKNELAPEFIKIQSNIDEAMRKRDYWLDLLNKDVVSRHQDVQEKLIDDALLRRWLGYQSYDEEKILQRKVEEWVASYYKEIKNFDKNNALFKQEKEEDIKNALRVIFRYSVIREYLTQRNKHLVNVLNTIRVDIPIRKQENLQIVSD